MMSSPLAPIYGCSDRWYGSTGEALDRALESSLALVGLCGSRQRSRQDFQPAA